MEESTKQLQALAERSLKEMDLLVIYLDGIQYGPYHVMAAIPQGGIGRAPNTCWESGKERRKTAR